MGIKAVLLGVMGPNGGSVDNIHTMMSVMRLIS